MKTTKVTISCHGDPSVGWFGNSTEIDLGIELPDEYKGIVGKALVVIFAEIWDDDAEYHFHGDPDPFEPTEAPS